MELIITDSIYIRRSVPLIELIIIYKDSIYIRRSVPLMKVIITKTLYTSAEVFP